MIMKTDNTINGRMPEEIKLGLECDGTGDCTNTICPYFPEKDCLHSRHFDTIAYIQQLENHIGELTEMVQQLERERDALMEDIKLAVRGLRCFTCFYDGNKSHMCDDCDVHTYCDWKWRGIQEAE